METLTEAIYQLATAMLTPVLVALLVMLGWSFFMLGSFLCEWQQRREDSGAWQETLGNIDEDFRKVRSFAYAGLRGDFMQEMRRVPEVSLEKTLTNLEIQAAGQLSWMSFGVRTGPLLGLMGTLIPMGPALIGLSAGNMETMASNLVIVFSTTVIGVFVGGLCYTMLLVRRQWYACDLADLEFLVTRLENGEGPRSA